MDQPLTTVSAATNQAASDPTDQTSPFGRATAALRSLGAARLLVLGATALGLFGLFAFLLLRVAEPHFTLLYGELELEDSAAIVGRLEALGVTFRLQGDGRAILVPADQALRLRMTLAEEGLPRGGTVGDEIFDQQSALGTTDFLANVNLRRALEGELARTIASLADVRAARVHLVLPRRELFRRNQVEPSASVTVQMYGGRRLDRRQVQAVQHLVAAAVPGLSPARIALVDHQGTLLARGAEGEPEGAFATQAEELRHAYEARLKRTVEELLERIAAELGAHQAALDRAIAARASASRELALALARALVPRALARQPLADIEAMLRDLLIRLEGQPRLTLALPPALVEAGQPLALEIAAEAGYRGELAVEADARLGPGDARLSWVGGNTERDLAWLEREAIAVLDAWLPEVPTEPRPTERQDPSTNGAMP